MSSQLLTRYDRLRDRKREAAARTAKAKAKYDQCRADEATLDHELEAARVALSKALESVAPPTPKQADPTKPATTTPRKVPPYLREVIETLPDRPGDMAVADLRTELGLSESTINTRLQKAMKAGLIERPKHAHYRLSEAGQAVKGGPKLQAVSG